MSITTGVCNSWIQESAQGVHEAADSYKIALIKPASAGAHGENTTNYSDLGADEVAAGLGYTAGGTNLSGFAVSLAAGVISVDFADAVWPLASFSAAGALIYNATQGNKALCVLSWGGTFTGLGGNFTVPIVNVMQGQAL
jgi:hypothetical protein